MLLRLSIAAFAVGCTTVVQEPADLDQARVHELRITQGDDTNVRVLSDPGWFDPGVALFVQNRLTGELVTDETDADGVLDVTIAGLPDDVYAISRFAASDRPAQITTRALETIPGWGWGFGSASGCAGGDFAVGIVQAPHDGDARVACFAEAEPTAFGDRLVAAVGTDAIRLETLHVPALRFRARVDHAVDVHASVVVEGSEGGQHQAIVPVRPDEVGLWAAHEIAAEALQDHGGAPLDEGLHVLGAWFWVEGEAAESFGLAIDDVVFESVVQD